MAYKTFRWQDGLNGRIVLAGTKARWDETSRRTVPGKKPQTICFAAGMYSTGDDSEIRAIQTSAPFLRGAIRDISAPLPASVGAKGNGDLAHVADVAAKGSALPMPEGLELGGFVMPRFVKIDLGYLEGHCAACRPGPSLA